jgi:hypothetical protein
MISLYLTRNKMGKMIISNNNIKISFLKFPKNLRGSIMTICAYLFEFINYLNQGLINE